MSAEKWLAKLAKPNVYKAKHGDAPHKPLLLLIVLQLADKGELPPDVLWLTPELSYQFDSFWQVVAYRRTQPPDVRMPFHHLGTDGCWTPYTLGGERSEHRKFTKYVEFDADFARCLSDPAFREQAKRIIIAKRFLPAERVALYELMGMQPPSDAEIAADEGFEPQLAVETGRELRFRLDIVAAYNYTCALTGYRVTTIGKGTIVDAAHIHPFSRSRNNDPQNGLALCKNAHWLFDAGLWSVDDDFRVVVASDFFDEASPDQKPLTEYHGTTLRLPHDERLWPDVKHLAWHRRHRFQRR